MSNADSEHIKQLREEQGLTLQEMAEILDIPTRRYKGYETGLHKFPLKVLIQLADYYETSVDYLVGATEQRIPHPRRRKEDE